MMHQMTGMMMMMMMRRRMEEKKKRRTTWKKAKVAMRTERKALIQKLTVICKKGFFITERLPKTEFLNFKHLLVLVHL